MVAETEKWSLIMSSENIGGCSTALLGEKGNGKERWRWEVLDLKEAKKQVLFSLPMILTNVFYYLIPLVSVMFAGQLGHLQLAGSTLANSWASVTGIAFTIGLSGALDTLCGQAFGARSYRMLGIYLQASCIITLFFSVAISVMWLYTETILIFLHQDPLISRNAALYLKYLIPGLFAYGFLQNILRFLQTQSVVVPLFILSALPMCIHVGIAYYLVHFTTLGFKGAPLAASISLWISVLLLVVFVTSAKRFELTWKGLSFESLWYIVSGLNLALPSAAMACLEDWAFEILVFLAGLMPNAEITTSLIAICVNTQAMAYMLTYGLSAAASTRVSNEIGAGNPDQAKNAMIVSLKLSVLLAIACVLALAFGHSFWAGFFSDSLVIKQGFASMAPLLAISIALDSVQGVFSGVARGCGWQHLAVYTNLATFYVIGTPIACFLGFESRLYVKGLWIGLICGSSCQASTLSFIMMRKKWTTSALCGGN